MGHHRHHEHHHEYKYSLRRLPPLEEEGHHFHYRRNSTEYGPANYTITTSVSIRVTPLHDHFISWGILWALFVIATCVAAWQVVMEYRVLKAARRGPAQDDGSGVEGEGETSTADVTRSIVSSDC